MGSKERRNDDNNINNDKDGEDAKVKPTERKLVDELREACPESR